MEPKQRILDAAVSLYARHGFRGTTTRLIAQEAGVNEVTLFRTFGSKEALIAEALRERRLRAQPTPLPDPPIDPERELAAWCLEYLHHMRDSSALIRTCLGELEERPDFAPDACEGPTHAGAHLATYLKKMSDDGLVEPGVPAQAAVAMFLGVCFADAMGRDIMPELFPAPIERAAEEYTHLFVRAIGLRQTAAPEGQADGDTGTISHWATSP